MTHHRSISGLTLAFAILIGIVPTGCRQGRDYADADRPNPIRDEFAAGRDRTPTPQTLYAMSRLLVARDREAQAEFVLTRLIEKHPDFVPAYVDLAEIQMRREATGDAINTLNAGLLIAPNNPLLMNNLGVCLMVSEDYGAALDRFTAASDAAPHVQRYRANRGVAMALMGEYDQALGIFMEVHSPEDAHRNLAFICQANGDEERAAEEFRQAIKPQKQ